MLGECSYGIYLLHGILLSLLFVDAAALTGSLTAGHLLILLPFAATAVVLVTSATYLLSSVLRFKPVVGLLAFGPVAIRAVTLQSSRWHANGECRLHPALRCAS